MAETETLPLDHISTEGTQARVALSDTIIREYEEALTRGDEFPAIDVYFDDTTYWLADGFHRLLAARQAGRDTVAAIVHQGGKREALLHAIGSNETHGYRRTDADRRHAVELMLADPEWQNWSNNEIARQCHVSEFLVRTIRSELEPAKETKETTDRTRKVTRGGKTYTMDTGRIGSATPRKQKAPSAPLTESPTDLASHAVTLESKEPETEPHASTIESKMDTSRVALPPEHSDEASLATAPEAQTHAVPMTPPPEPDLVHAWQQASADKRKEFVATYHEELRTLLAAWDKQTKKRTSTPRGMPQKAKQRRQRVPTKNPQ